jgi:phosphoribosylformimino-5-aminoimidazole carboxamide ribotide isomerase
VDFKDGKILSKTEIGCDELIEIFNEYLPNEVILLDISRVGTFKGINKGFISKFSGINSSIIIGGGIQGDDIPTVFDLGVDKVLVGSALHKGKLKL